MSELFTPEDLKPTPHYDRYPKSRVTVRMIYAVLLLLLALTLWYRGPLIKAVVVQLYQRWF